MQLISGLRRAGHHVTFSMPLKNFLAGRNVDKILPLLSKEDLWASEHFFEQDVVLNRIQPDVAIGCNINTYRTPPRFPRNIVQIMDMYGPLQFEGLLLDNPNYDEAMVSGPMLESRCRDMVDKFRSVDYVVTVSERQKYFWSAYCSLAGFSFAELNMLVCPAVFDVPPVQRNPSPQMSVVYAGGFYPWQNPNRFLERTAVLLDQVPGATLHVFGGPHAGLVNEADAKAFLARLQTNRSVNYHGYRPVEEVLAHLSQCWFALELMERNIERELAITGRTLEFLSSGTPVVYNDYSTLSGLIAKYRAGWTVSPQDDSALERIIGQLTNQGLSLVNELSANATRLAKEEFLPDKAIAPLVDLCSADELPSRQTNTRVTSFPAKKAGIGRVLVISPDGGTLVDLRLRNPMRALHRQGLIDGMTVTNVSLEPLRNDHTVYDAIVTQRALPIYIYDLLENLALNFIADVDDNLLARAAYRTDPLEVSITTGLRLCTAVTTPNPRLVRSFESYAGLQLAHKAFMTPNALPFGQGAYDRPAAPPSQLLWIQSDIAALDRNRENVVRAVEEFSNQHGLPIILIGRNVLDRPQFRNQVVMGEIDFTSNLQVLATAPLSIGIAPLETDSDQGTLDFIAGKSDLKMVLFAGFGHCGVYSAAPPYTDSDLQNGLNVIGNSAAEWKEALEYEFREGWKSIAAKARDVRAKRDIDKVAAETWLPALQAGRLARPVTGAEIYDAFQSRFDMGRTPIQTLSYLAANEDVLGHCLQSQHYSAWLHYEKHGRQEQRIVRYALQQQKELLQRIDEEHARVLERIGKEISRLRQQNHALEAENQFLQGENQVFRQNFSDVTHSKSWRVTAPLRRITEGRRRNGNSG